MATLVARDSSGVFAAATDEVEVPSRRTRTGKVFSLPDAPDGRQRFRVGASTGPIHYRFDPYDESQPFEEIDLGVVLTPTEPWDSACESNGYQVRLWQHRQIGGHDVRCIAEFRRAGAWLRMAPLVLMWVNNSGQRQVIGRPQAGIAPTIDNDLGQVTWPDVLGPGLDFRYNLAPDKFAKTVVVNSASDLPAPTISQGGLRLVVVMALAWGGAVSEGFATGVDVDDLGGEDDPGGAPDEELTDPDPMRFTRADLREAFWQQRPRSWDSSAEPDDADPETDPSIPLQVRLQRRGNRVLGLFAVRAADLQGATFPVYIDTVMTEEQTSASSDDANEYSGTYPGTANYDDTGTAHYIGKSDVSFQIVGMRFQTIPIGNSDTINSASITYQARSASSLDTDVTHWAEDADDPATHNSTNRRPGSDLWGSRTTASAQWDIGTTSWARYSWYQSSDMANVVQELVNRGGWASNNDMLFLLANTTDVLEADRYRRVYTYDQGATDGPKFNCTYTAAGGTQYEGASAIVAGSVVAAAGALKAAGASAIVSDASIAADGTRIPGGGAAAVVYIDRHRRYGIG